LSNDPDFQNYVDFLGSFSAKSTFERFVVDLKLKKAEKRRLKQLQRLPEIFHHLIVGNVDQYKNKSANCICSAVVTVTYFYWVFRSWVDIVDCLVEVPSFLSHFRSSHENQPLDHQNDDRLPFDLLCTPEAEDHFRSVLAKIEQSHKSER